MFLTEWIGLSALSCHDYALVIKDEEGGGGTRHVFQHFRGLPLKHR